MRNSRHSEDGTTFDKVSFIGMGDFPAVPYFLFAKDDRGYIELIEKLEVRAKLSERALEGDADAQIIAYDAEGIAWSFRWTRPEVNRGFLGKVIARVQSPIHTVDLLWTALRPYAIEELRTAYVGAIEEDDDILTQFADRDELTRRVEACENFGQILEVWQWAASEDALDG